MQCRVDGQRQGIYLDFRNQENLSKVQGGDIGGGGVGVVAGVRASPSVLAGLQAQGWSQLT